MKIFISWSGNESKMIAEFLKKWIAQIIQAAEPWISVDIEKGKKWNHEINKNLKESKVGIFCVTKENLNSPWILFEAGAISKTEDSYVCTFLIDIIPTDITGPLSLFQATRYNKEDVYKLLTAINKSIAKSGERSLESENLKELFEIFYPQLEKKIDSIIKTRISSEVSTKAVRSERELLEESVQILRQLKSSRIDNSLEKEAKELLNFYAEKFAKIEGDISYYDVGTEKYFGEFMKRIQENPLLLKVYEGLSGLENEVKRQFDGLPF